MTGYKVHGLRESTCTRKVLAVLYEKGLEFEFVHVELKDGEHKKEPYLSLNPFGQIPAFQDGDLTLFESRSITQYLAHGHQDTGNQLLYLGNKNLARMLVWMEAEAHQFDPVASKLAWEQVFKGFYGLPTDQAAVEECTAKLAKVLDVYEARLSKSKYLACDSYTLADLHHVPVIQYLYKLQKNSSLVSRISSSSFFWASVANLHRFYLFITLEPPTIMASFKVYGHPFSAATRRVLAATANSWICRIESHYPIYSTCTPRQRHQAVLSWSQEHGKPVGLDGGGKPAV